MDPGFCLLGSYGPAGRPLSRQGQGIVFASFPIPGSIATLGSMQLSPGKRIWFVALVPAAVVLCISLCRKDRGLDVDEIYWVGSTYYYDLLVHQQDLHHSDWQLLPALENPPIGKYLMGLYLDLFGRRISTPDLLASFYLHFKPEKGHWGSGVAYDKRAAVATRAAPEVAEAMRAHGRFLIDRTDVKIARSMIVFCAMCCAAVVGLIGYRCGSPMGGLLAGCVCAAHPIMVQAYGIALIDMVALPFACLSVLLYVTVFTGCAEDDKRRRRRSVWLVAGIGGSLACACGAKMNSVVVAVVGVLLWVFAAAGQVQRRQVANRSAAVVLVGGGILSFALFAVPNPTLYPDLLDGLVALFREHALTVEIQKSFLGGGLYTVPDRFVVLGRVLTASPLLLAAVAGMAGFQGWRCVSEASLSPAERRFAIVVCWWGVAFVLLLAWLPLAWGRYALPLLPPTCLIIGKTCDDLVRYARKRPKMAATALQGGHGDDVARRPDTEPDVHHD